MSVDNDGLHKRRGIWYYSLKIQGKRRFFSTKTRGFKEAEQVRAAAIKAQQEDLVNVGVNLSCHVRPIYNAILSLSAGERLELLDALDRLALELTESEVPF